MKKTIFLSAIFLFGVFQCAAQFVNLPLPNGKNEPYDACKITRPRVFRTCDPSYERKPLSEPLLEAIAVGDLAAFKKLIAEGADVNVKGENGITPLLTAVQYGDLEMVEILLEAGANPNSETEGSWSPLIAAANSFCTKIPETLIKAGASVNVKTSNGYTPLFNAAEANNFEAVKLLIANGADIYTEDLTNHERSPFISAVKHNNLPMVKFFLEKDTDKKFAALYDTALYYALIGASDEMARFLIGIGADPVGKGKNRGMPLAAAISRGNFEMVKYLVGLGAEVNPPQGFYPPLNPAVIYGHTEIVKFLIEKGADVNRKTDWSALIEAVRNNRLEIVKILIKAGANVNARAYDGWTVLMTAAGYDKDYDGKIRLEIVKVLIANGADVNGKDDDEDLTVLMIARANERHEIVKLLEENGVTR